MPDFEQDVDDGFRSALTRWGSEIDITIDDSLLAPLEEPRSLALAVLYGYETSDRPLERPGVTMFAEWVAVAAIVRIAHDEPPLQRDDLDAFLPAAIRILNTAFCPPPTNRLGESPTVGGFWPSEDEGPVLETLEAHEPETADEPERETEGA